MNALEMYILNAIADGDLGGIDDAVSKATMSLLEDRGWIRILADDGGYASTDEGLRTLRNEIHSRVRAGVQCETSQGQ